MLHSRWQFLVTLSGIYHLLEEGLHSIYQWWMSLERYGRSDITLDLKAIPSRLSREIGVNLSLLRDSSRVIKSSFEWKEMLRVFHVIQLLHKRRYTNSLVRLFSGTNSSYLMFMFGCAFFFLCG
ncbi:Uncharacterized protein TCM_031758 [Theobroma cacao]|uniref:Uncharacterized protein n=1 Tax=Theobroma cacao TaxID=3641 RepID=A0A061F7C6_THECC|nr:Uncharacterized protein TCM_031758 [Theobroma cacao]